MNKQVFNFSSVLNPYVLDVDLTRFTKTTNGFCNTWISVKSVTEKYLFVLYRCEFYNLGLIISIIQIDHNTSIIKTAFKKFKSFTYLDEYQA